MKKTFTFIIIMLLFVTVSAQDLVNVTFKGNDADGRVEFEYVVVRNLTRGWAEILTWPDTVLILTDRTGIQDRPSTSGFFLYQNAPNPFNGTTYVNLKVAEPGDVSLAITDITGRVVGVNNYSSLQPGVHEMSVTLSSAGIYFLTARQNGKNTSVKMVNHGNGGGNTIALTGNMGTLFLDTAAVQPKNSYKGSTDKPFALGDTMEYEGLDLLSDTQMRYKKLIRQLSTTTETITFEFNNENVYGDGFSCPNNPIMIDYDGNIYNTVQIVEQCWARENLRTKHSSDGTDIIEGDSSITSSDDPYYYVNPNLDAIKYGYYYNWKAAVNACPDGWHLPSDQEWTDLTDSVGKYSNYNPVTPNYDTFYVAKALASAEGWTDYQSGNSYAVGNNQSNNNSTHFGALPAGLFGEDSFYNVGNRAYFWSLSEYMMDGYAWNRLLLYNDDQMYRGNYLKFYGFSVRCLRD